MHGRRRHSVVLLAILLVFAAQSPAWAGKRPRAVGTVTSETPDGRVAAGTTDGGYGVDVGVDGDIGHGSGRGKAHRVRRVPASCWWAPIPESGVTKQSMIDWYDKTLDGGKKVPQAHNPGNHSVNNPPKRDEVVAVAVADRAARGEKIAWYRATCRSTITAPHLRAFVNSEVLDADLTKGEDVACYFYVPYQALPYTVGPQGGTVTPGELAEIAHEELDLPEPVVERNPKLKNPADATVVNFPTWFWVTDPDAVGGDKGTRTVRAQIGTSFAQVTATTPYLHIDSPAGKTICTPALAQTKWTPGSAEDAGCSVEFDHPSVSYPQGFPVVTSVQWVATWTGNINGHTVTGSLPARTRTHTTNVPVAEIQILNS